MQVLCAMHKHLVGLNNQPFQHDAELPDILQLHHALMVVWLDTTALLGLLKSNVLQVTLREVLHAQSITTAKLSNLKSGLLS